MLPAYPLRLQVKRGDTAPAFRAQCLATTLDEKGRTQLTPADLTGATAKVLFHPQELNRGVAFSLVGAVSADGWVTGSWPAGSTDTAAGYDGEVEVTYSNGKVQTFPASGYFLLEILPDLG